MPVKKANQQIMRATSTSKHLRVMRKGINRHRENKQLLAPLKLQVKNTCECFLDMPQVVKRDKTRKDLFGTPDLREKRRQHEKNSWFPVGLITSIALGSQGFAPKGCCIVKQVCQFVLSGGKTPVVSVGISFREQQGVSHRTGRVGRLRGDLYRTGDSLQGRVLRVALRIQVFCCQVAGSQQV